MQSNRISVVPIVIYKHALAKLTKLTKNKRPKREKPSSVKDVIREGNL